MLAFAYESILGMWELEVKSMKEKAETRTGYETGGADARSQCSEHGAASMGSSHFLKQHEPGLGSGETSESSALRSFLQDRIEITNRFR